MPKFNSKAAYCGYALLLIAIMRPFTLQAQETNNLKSIIDNFNNLPLSAQLNALSQASEYDVKMSVMRPSPKVSIGVENFLGTNSFKGFNSTETTLQLSQDLQLFGRRNAYINYAQSIAQSSKLEIQARKSDFIRDISLLWIEYEESNYALDLAEEKISNARDDLGFVSLLVEGGREPRLRQLQAEADLANAQLEKIQILNRISDAKNSLLTLSQYQGEIKPLIYFMNKIPKSSNFDITHNSNYQILLSRQNTSKAAIEITKAENRPNVEAFLGARHLASDNSVGFVGGVSVTMPLGSKRQTALHQKQAISNSISFEIDNFIKTTEGKRLELIAKINLLNREINYINDTLPSLNEVYNLSKIGLKAGKVNLIDVQSSREELYSLKDKLRIAKILRAKAGVELSYIENRLPFEVANEK